MIKINFSNLMQDSIGKNGLTEQDFNDVDIAGIIETIKARKYPELEFLDLPVQDTRDVKHMGRYAREFEDLLILGIGGSALGPRTILDSLKPFHNYSYTGKPRVFIYDNVDPTTLSNILKIISPSTLINVITKSGSTAETIASFMIMWQRLTEQSLKPMDHIIITTDPQKGSLRQIANEYGIRSLPIAPGVGGRYSVLSPVGLLLAEAIGVNSDEMLRGAKDIHEKCMSPDLWQNPALLFSAGLYQMHKLKGRDITVLIPYADRLKSFSEWFCQLWAESLGKDGKGLTPYPSVGTTDQHSQLQLWMEGPDDKVVVFLSIENYGSDLEIPRVFENLESFGYLGGHSLSELIKTEQEASEIALTKNSKPSITIKLLEIDAYHIGQLFHFFEIATAITGFLFSVNPFNQPGVEEGKNLTYGMMGKKGYEAKKEEFIKYRERKRLTI
jgi:glucose-6-phosphate isomerase